MNSFTIKTEKTSNSNILKFTANQFLSPLTSYEFKNIDEAKQSPLAQQLFYLPFVKTIYIAQNFIAIEKFSIVEWADVQEELASQIETFLNSGQALVLEIPQKNKIPVTIYAESTPNPSVIKFVANKSLVDGTFEFKNIDEAKHAPLAQALFQFLFVKEVFISANYVSVSKYDSVEWEEVTLEIREFIRNYIEEGKQILKDEILSQTSTTKEEKHTEREALDDISKEIINILNEYVRPAVESDGGNIEFQSYDEQTKTVKVMLQGACSGCPSSTFTLKNGIENMLKEMLKDSELKVEAING
ncbi:MAG: hypothetical protein COZ75_03690 [Flavobacteriaceae bacterium CG_4_8_14_3_um_filter_34_10]|nr:MAG: hypothetical protein COW66_02270 [Flavobacteriaceae bacterium CG18_big_fil_WC_8_21_14_2_50_34_36]PIX10025.1 MAG: hypothetical protein COZ75_03690 [Flavobacteriaceae bacterium CG_4_8_14_3_um_filter_34_10]PIZ07659.1 MAG: hypothetical protein COY56_07850 [Flavobacteriaceae bacterium CG_4_10_14_0_8_um_filter_34_31]PJC08001.1 MAG: hypothetical protein CO068_03190 [Flavobacteriaceae bacterium CG_4_9_14_0_8_um_filter_34_30]